MRAGNNRQKGLLWISPDIGSQIDNHNYLPNNQDNGANKI